MPCSRALIVAEARDWVGTAFHHQGRLKKTDAHKGGCDCIGLIIGVARVLKIPYNQQLLIADCDISGYGRLPDGKKLYQALQYFLEEIPISKIQPADILLFRFDKNPQHVGFVSDYKEEKELGLIHCYAQVRKVVEHRLDEVWKEKLVAAFTFRNCL